MAKMNELSQVLDELLACGEALANVARGLKELYAAEPAEEMDFIKEDPDAPPPRYSFTDVRAAFSAKSHAGYTAQVKGLITKYGADKLSAIKEEDYAAIMAELEAII